MTSQKDLISDAAELQFTTKGLEPKLLTPTEETAQTFASFFPYAWNFIYAKNVDRTVKPEWKTETRYPITGRALYDHWADPDTLIGVRFGVNTAYGMLDIDKNSPYHPQQNEKQFRGILQALEDIGLVRPLIMQSSFSEGLHVYYPLPEPVSSFALACGIKASLKKHGYEIASGVLETFPNTKAYGTKEKPTEFNGHRLPLQKGSYMLNDDLEKIGNDLNHFVFVWQICQDSQDIDLIKEAIAEAKENYQPPKLSGKTEEILKWREDLENQIAKGWTGDSQSNRLLYLMGKYARIFLGYVDDEAIAKYIEKTARASAGFTKFCKDIHRLDKKAKSIAEWCMRKHFPWGSKKTEPTKEENTSKPDRQAERIERIRLAVSELNKTGTMPQTIRGMAQAIAKTAKVSVETLYDHKELWHPEFTKSTCNALQTKEIRQESPLTDIPIEMAETETQSAVTETPLYEAWCFFETPLRGQELPKIAKPELQDLPDCPKFPKKPKEPMWVEQHGRLAPPKNENASDKIFPKPLNATENADCLQIYQTAQNQAVSTIDIQIRLKKLILENPVLRRCKSPTEIARLQSELAQLESDRQFSISADSHPFVDELDRSNKKQETYF